MVDSRVGIQSVEKMRSVFVEESRVGMDKLRRWMGSGSLMVGIVGLLVLGLAPMASAGKGEWAAAKDRWQADLEEEWTKWAAAREERQADWGAKKEAWAAARGQRQADWERKKAEWEKAQADQVAEETEQEPAAKLAAWEVMRGTASGAIGPEGGMLMASYKGGPGGKDDVWVQFIVPKNALEVVEEISMTLQVDTGDFSALTLTFTRAGLQFKIPAKLKIKLGKDLAEGLGFQSMVGIHYSTDPATGGPLEEVVPLFINPGRRMVEVSLDVPGFSRYSLGGDP